MRKRFLVIVLIGLLIRIGVMFLDFSWDVNNHMSWAADLRDPRRGFGGFYDTISAAWFATKYPNYPPFAMYLFYLLLPVQKLIGSCVWQVNIAVPAFPSALVFFVQSRIFAAAVFKIPSIMADFGLAYLLYKFAQKNAGRGSTIPLFAASAILLNPAFFYNSAYWGQIDVIPLLLAVGAVLLLIRKKLPVITSLLFTASLLVKPTTLVFLPFFAYFFFAQFRLRKTIISLLVSAAFFFISFIPFVPLNTLVTDSLRLYSVNILAAQSLKHVTNGAFNIWAILAGLQDIPDNVSFVGGISYQLTGIALLLASVVFSFRSFHPKKKQEYRMVYLLALSALDAFLFLTRMHERYSLLPIPFLIMAAVYNKKLVPVVWFLSVISALNLYKSWPVPRVEFLFSAVSHPVGYSVLALCNLAAFLYVLRIVRAGKKS